METNKKPGFIYALSDKTGVRYIGQAKNPARRYTQHCSIVQNTGNTHKQKWIKSLLIKGEKPEMLILSEVDDMDNAEINYIKLYTKQGHRLVNGNKGGTDMSHANRAKKTKPWGSKHSPVQHLLMSYSQSIRFFKKTKNDVYLKKVEFMREYLLDLIKLVGRDKINDIYIKKHGLNYTR